MSILFLRRSSIGNIRRFMSTNLVVSDALPANLKLADATLLALPESPIVSDDRYMFPVLSSALPESLPIFSFEKPGSVVGSARLSPKMFNVALRKDLVLEVVRYQRNMKRQPQRTKRVRDIAGSNKKPWPQKGTGQAQVIFHPLPHPPTQLTSK